MKQPHILLDNTINAHYALLPGDPARLDHIKQFLDDPQELACNREYRSIIGTYKGLKILAVSTGIGGASAAIAIEELHNIGVHTMIRIGSCGALQPNIKLGDLVIAEGAIRDEGASNTYVNSVFPATPNFHVLKAIVETCDANNYDYHLGIVHTHDSFYTDDHKEVEKQWAKHGALGADLETAALLTIGRLRNIRTASILNNVVVYGEETTESIANYVDGENKTLEGERREILTALEAFYKLEVNA